MGVRGSQQPVAIAVEAGQRCHPAGEVAAREPGCEQFATVLDPAGTINVVRQDAVDARGPGDLVERAIGVDVELDPATDRGEHQAGCAEVKHQRVDGAAC